ncbi:MAG TPA: hypothetical protein PLN69_11405 [bacterium]|mgnify:CR=1 FL=1|nr:hypothetical protein [bacterium]
MSLKSFECNSCSYIIFMDENQDSPSWCPSCRSTMSEAGIEGPEECVEYRCEECGAEFCTPPGAMEPYKCPSCNYTFPSNPNRRVKHKL